MKEYYAAARTSVNLQQLEQIIPQLQQLQLPRAFISGWEEQNLIRSTWLVSRLLGYESNYQELAAGCYSSPSVVAQIFFNYFQLLKDQPWLTAKKITPTLVEKLYARLEQKVITKNTSPGKIKSAPLADLLDWLNEDEITHPLIKAGVSLKQVVDDKIFSRDNELMARLLSVVVATRANYNFGRQLLPEEYDLLSLSRYQGRLLRPSRGDYAPWLDYYIKGVCFALTWQRDFLTQVSQTFAHTQRLTAGEQTAWQKLSTAPRALKLQQVAALWGISKQRAHVVLNILRDKGRVEQLGQGKKLTYRSAWRTWKN